MLNGDNFPAEINQNIHRTACMRFIEWNGSRVNDGAFENKKWIE
jgi:hypothetical protein